MLLTTFDKELYEKGLKEEAYEEGIKSVLVAQIKKKLNKGKSIETIAEEVEESIETVTNIIQEEIEK